ncbi:MAG: SDR family oxidoreductase [Methanobacteriota archaeon]
MGEASSLAMRVLVTGATGFIGSHVASRLVDDGHEVHVLRRASSPSDLLSGIPVKEHQGDVTDAASLRRASAGVRAVFHVAGFVSLWRGHAEAMRRVNVEGTRNVLAAAAEAGVERVVHTSSVAAVGYPEDGAIADEGHPYNWLRYGIPYMETKRAAEDEVRRAVREGLDAVIVNPGTVLGPGDLHYNGGAFLRQLVRGRILGVLPGGVNFVDVRDVSAGHLLAWQQGSKGERYILGNENLTYADFFARAARVAGVRPPRRRLSPLVARFAAWWQSRRAEARGKVPAVTPDSVRALSMRLWYSSAKASHDLGYAPAVGVDASAKETLDWYRAHGRL